MHAQAVCPARLTAGLALILAGRVAAQSFTTLHSFSAGSGIYQVCLNGDGAVPEARMILLGNTLYGTIPRC